MTQLPRILAAATLLVACAQTVNPGDDAAALGDGGALVDRPVGGEAAAPDTPFVNTPGVACGPNRCRGQEICCNAACGVCAFAGECVDHGCVGQGGDAGR